ncbi:hypothetical protein HPP92_010346 [Vanilla planifolia]|uniref:Uncharacterized protein n=1 Tax=Vanilla planifolia TaxID=51239 RepID=A0A835RAA1_VANPL|nr:hypothetical protein HPP92_010346 [Vanilla planifolia]
MASAWTPRKSRLSAKRRHKDGRSATGRSLGRNSDRRLTAMVGRKLKELQRLIPGGEDLVTEQLFTKTATYIFHLRMRLHFLRALSKLYVS